MNWKITLLVCMVILLIAAGSVMGIFLTEPVAQRSSAVRETAMLVDVVRVERGTFQPAIVATGTVRPEREILLSPRISGEVISMAEPFTPGGFVDKGEILLQIDPSDYEAALLQRKSELRQAHADLQMELGRQDLAKSDYEELAGTISSEYKTLVLRQPQLDTARAMVESAEAAVRRAELDLERTRIRAPFDSHILSREAHVGSQVAPGQTLGRLVGVATYWVEVNLPVSDLQWVDLPQNASITGSPARIRNRAAWPRGTFREARVHRLIGELEAQTRLARVLLTVSDPLAHQPESAGLPPLMVGSFVEVRIEGRPIPNVIRLERKYLRQNNTVWVNEENALMIRRVEPVFLDDDYAYIGDGLSENDLVVTTNLATVVDGARLRLEDEG